MLASRPTERSSSPSPVADGSQLGADDRSQPSQGGDHDAGIEGVIYYTSYGEGYVIYASPPAANLC